MNDTAETTRTIEQVLAIRLRAAQLRETERTIALVKEQQDVEQAWGHRRDEDKHADLLEALSLAYKAIALVQREINVQQGLDVEPVPYDAASPAETRRYAALLIWDDPGLGVEEALSQARADERIRFADHMTRTYGSDWNKDPEGDEG